MYSFEAKVEQALKAKGMDILAPLDRKSIRLINRMARGSDQPNLYPHVAAADKAIRWYARVYFPANGNISCLEYAMGLDARMSEIVNAA